MAVVKNFLFKNFSQIWIQMFSLNANVLSYLFSFHFWKFDKLFWLFLDSINRDIKINSFPEKEVIIAIF